MAFRYPNPPKKPGSIPEKAEKHASAKTQTPEALPYDSRPLTAALSALSQDEIDSMLGNIANLETQLARLNIATNEDAMLRLVTEGLQRLTFFLDAVKRHNDEPGDGEQNLVSDSTESLM
jgi:hypothetical protein